MSELKRAKPAYEPTTHSFLIYRAQMLHLLAMRKSLHDQLCIELPCLMGFRTKEITTWRAEHIDFDSGDTHVLDAKRHKFFTVPLHVQVAAHAKSLLADRREGLVIQNTSRAWRNRQNKPISIQGIEDIWHKYVQFLPNGAEITPIVGRRFFAAWWFHDLKLPLTTLSLIMRQDDPTVTLEQVKKLVFYEDLREDYKKFESASTAAVPMAAENAH